MADPFNLDDVDDPAYLEELGKEWESYRAGKAVPCRRDATPIALSVDASVRVYRFVCPHCGHGSPWFESTDGKLRVRGNSGRLGVLDDD